ncbi:MAG: hypothetical protein JRI23_15025 [Deltaproteobacteria bacterium]|nr:hypothetical protein [Deltaproteobacteria bacterium]MBW2533063.1 hypothetical protein [Deltaproteobacteria bacterium]
MSLVLLTGAVVVAWGVSTAPTHIGPLRWVGWGLSGLLLIGPIAITTSTIVAFRMRPGEEVCWTPVEPERSWQLEFVARRSRYHGLWMSYDVHYQGDSYGVGQLHCHIEVYVAGQLVDRRLVTTAWSNRYGRSDFATGVRGGDLPSGSERAIREVHCGVSGSGPMRLAGQVAPRHFQALSLLHKIDVEPGQHVAVRGLLYRPSFPCQQLRAHGFIALS